MKDKTKCFLVRTAEFRPISDKAAVVRTFDGATCTVPLSQYCIEPTEENGVWIAAWLLERSPLQYSTKRIGWYNEATGRVQEQRGAIRHVPGHIDPISPDTSKFLRDDEAPF